MPSNFLCRSCGLFFTTGWLHDQNLRMLVCGKCGMMHSVEVNCPEGEGLTAAVARLRAQPKPVFVDADRLARIKASDALLDEVILGVPHTMDWIELGSLELMERNPAGTWHSVGSSKLTPEGLRCHACGLATLIAKWPISGDGCPACGATIEGPWMSWITMRGNSDAQS